MSLVTTSDSNFGRLSQVVEGDDIVFHLPVTVDESLELPEKPLPVRSRVIFDCQQCTLVSSIGASLWIQWMRQGDSRRQYVFRNCPRKIIDMMNYMPDFLPKNFTIESFYAPYECLACGFEKVELNLRGKDFLEATDGQGARVKVPSELNCPKCAGKMEFAVLENVYLRFLKSEV